MNAHARSFEDRAAVRESVPLLVGLFGSSGSGKTFSALRLAFGIQKVAGGDVGVIDTEARRALQYADLFPPYRHLQFDPPHGSLDYLAALRHFVDAGVRTIIVDSMSHEHEGEGGMLSYAAAELERMGGSDRVKMASFIKPKAARRQLINGILQLNANMIFCFRAKESVKPVKINGKTEIVNQGFVPIAGDEFLFEMTTCALLMPNANGVPTWASELPGESLMIKKAAQFRWLYEGERRPLDEDTGTRLAEWAKGGAPMTEAEIADLVESAKARAEAGTEALREFMGGLSYIEVNALKARKLGLGEVAKKADAARS